MINEDYCSYEVAKLLKEKGFDEPIQYFYKFDSKELYRGTIFTNTQIGDKFYNAPTHQMAMAWLREKHYIHIDIIIQGNGSNIMYRYNIRPFKIIYPTRNFDSIDIYYTGYTKSYNEAIEEGIKYCLVNLEL